MTEPETPKMPETPKTSETPKMPETPKKSTIAPMRIALWVLVAGVGAFMLITGIVGILVKG